MFNIFKRKGNVGINPPPKSKKPGLPGKQNILTSGNYKIVNVTCEDYNTLNQVNFDKVYLVKDLETEATEWVDEYRLRAMKRLGLIK